MSTDAIIVEPPLSDIAQHVGLSSPPESTPALESKADGSESELSDLEDLEDDVGEVEPALWEDDGHIPVFRPTSDQFKNFSRYMNKINPWGMKSGIVKVQPPAEWLGKLPPLDESIKKIKIREPIKQDIMGTSGTYRQANIVHQRSYNLPQWRQLCEQSEHQPPARRGERRTNQDKPARPTPKFKASSTPTTSSQKKRKPGRPSKGKPKATHLETAEGGGSPDRLPTPVSPTMKAEDDVESVKQEPDDEDETPVKGRCGGARKMASVSSRRKYNRREVAGKIDEEAFKDFKYQLEGEEFTPERCEELERAYWKTLTYAPPLYGADMPGSLFDDRTTEWNLGKLENILDIMGAKIPGVNTAYLYLGMWKATFAWHLEDVDLYSINYLHFGAPKQWYSISQADARRFEAAMKSIWPVDAKACDQFLRHKTFLISPSQLLQNFNIRVNKIVHHPGEFIITFPYGYHSGYNLGYNCAEAVNFALDSWLQYGRLAKKCDCSQAQDSVWIDVRELERKLRGEETDYDETDEDEDEEDENGPIDLPTPPESSGDARPKAPRRKRKRNASDKGDKVGVKKLRVRFKPPAKEPCVLCPNDIPSEPLLPTEDGQKAHRLCALYIPETSIETGDREVVMDIKYIDKARLDLKCNYCRSKKGACFQCSQKKCTRAYHATCAAAAGVFVEQGEIPVFAEDGTEYKDHGIEFSCRFHRVKRDKKLDSDALDDDERIRKAAMELKVGDVCQMQHFEGGIFAGVIIQNQKSEEMVLVDILPRGDRLEVEYKWLLLPDPADYHLPKPSASAIPIPKSFKAKESLNISKRQADDPPRAEDAFVNGCTWAEFKCQEIAPNPAQVKVEFEKENQIWHYLGKTSTEARAQFTEDPSKLRHNPKGHFLDTIPKPVTSHPRQSYAASYPTNTTQNALNRAQAPSRPQVDDPAKSEKPYMYKPRSVSDTYRVDPQAYHSQQNFLKQATPYSFGSDPRYRPGDSHPPTGHSGNPSPSPYTSQSPPAMSSYSQPQPGPKPVVSTSTSNNSPRNNSNIQSSGSSRSQGTGGNSRGHNQRSSPPNPFAKYSYLQVQHNRSSLDYKSPYRPGGGFMNGYQGNLEKHLQQTMFQRSDTGHIAPAPYPSNGPAKATPYTRPQAPNTNTPSSNTPVDQKQNYGLNHGASKQQSLPHQVTKSASQTGWEKKESAQLHPAIRQEYNSMFHHQYQPSQRPQPSQFQPPILPNSAMQQSPLMNHGHQTQQVPPHITNRDFNSHPLPSGPNSSKQSVFQDSLPENEATKHETHGQSVHDPVPQPPVWIPARQTIINDSELQKIVPAPHDQVHAQTIVQVPVNRIPEPSKQGDPAPSRLPNPDDKAAYHLQSIPKVETRSDRPDVLADVGPEHITMVQQILHDLKAHHRPPVSL